MSKHEGVTARCTKCKKLIEPEYQCDCTPASSEIENALRVADQEEEIADLQGQLAKYKAVVDAADRYVAEKTPRNSKDIDSEKVDKAWFDMIHALNLSNLKEPSHEQA